MSTTDGYASDSSSDTRPPSSSSTVASSISSLAPPSSQDSLNNLELQCPQLPAHYPALPFNETPRTTAAADVQTPDGWIRRNPDLIRLTGKHPFNCEAPVQRLYDAGFITPAHLHFVRNHGAVPRVDADKALSWRIRIHGLVEHECTLSLRDLQDRFEVVTLPVTLVCAGNRRKEQNVLRKSLGFSWGSSGLSTALWTGVYLADVLASIRPRRGAKHVVFEGADTSLPNGPYGTSQRLSWAVTRERGMLIAWAMNGLPLEPDHGFPVRMIIPGQIGGRSVKWLSNIEVSARESQHYLHFFDNRVLPTYVSPEQARSEKSWWYDPRYLITELNVNSAIAKPDHGETLDVDPAELQESSELDRRTYKICGYAYAGGGRRVTRAEISLDDGTSWRLADIEYPEDVYRDAEYRDATYGSLDLTARDTCFCWCLWSTDVAVSALVRSTSITLRAMDEAMNAQPRDMYPNATSMMNNWWFRVAVVKTETGVRFEHPAPVGRDTPGWMERMKAAGEDILRPAFGAAKQEAKPGQGDASVAEVPLTDPEVTRRITRSELEAQDKQKPWFVVQGEVYDGTDYLKDHPGGGDSILLVAGDDATDDFMAIHSVDAKLKLRQFHIGTLVDGSRQAVYAESTDDDDDTAPFLRPKAWKQVHLTEMKQVNHDSFLYRFALSSPQQPLGLPVGQHVFARLRRKDTHEIVQRAYTPVSRQDAVGAIEFLVKLYLPCTQFPAGGKMTTGFHQLQVGDTVELKGPLGSFTWAGPGAAVWKGVPRRVRHVGLVCGGSGITPILQVLRSILRDAADGTRVWLLDANKSDADILFRDELRELHARHGEDRFALRHTLSVVPEGWAQSHGRITDAMLATHLPPPSPDALIMVCGPAGMISDVLQPGLRKLGWDLEHSLVIF
ncbi:hypothetical protein B0H21DRAFT_856810 [Amylocystis lapponica]|nr:hypothetical protein B0H21DRAFT_856810 [Amylocystis lapponica]